jgi:hypothetical protein
MAVLSYWVRDGQIISQRAHNEQWVFATPSILYSLISCVASKSPSSHVFLCARDELRHTENTKVSDFLEAGYCGVRWPLQSQSSMLASSASLRRFTRRFTLAHLPQRHNQVTLSSSDAFLKAHSLRACRAWHAHCDCVFRRYNSGLWAPAVDRLLGPRKPNSPP